MENNTRKKSISIIVIGIILIAIIFNKNNIIYNVQNIKNNNAMATNYDNVTDFQNARWKEIQNNIFGENVAGSVTDTALATANVVQGNQYFNWASLDSKTIMPWDGSKNKSDGTEYTDADFYNNGALEEETVTYTTTITEGVKSTRTVKYQVYNVYNANQLRYVLESKASTQENKKIYIRNDIDLAGYNNVLWSSISVNNGEMYIEGNGHTIYNLNSNTSGIFSTINSYMTILNLNIENIKIVSGRDSVSPLGQPNAKGIRFENVHVKSGFIQSSASNAAGFMSRPHSVNAFVKDCSSSNLYLYGAGEHTSGFSGCICPSQAGNGGGYGVKYTVDYPEQPEALFGNNSTSLNTASSKYPFYILDCYSIDCEIFATKGHAGGLISCIDSGIICKNSFSNNSIYGEGQVGVIMGCQVAASKTPLYDDSNKQTVNCYFENCYSSGVVEGKNAIGGFMGADNDTAAATIYKNCYSTSMVGMDYSGNKVGGFIGETTNTASTTIEGYGTVKGVLMINCYAAGEVGNISTSTDLSVAKSKRIGGFMGSYSSVDYLNIFNCFYDKQTTAMRKVAVGLEGNNGTCQLKGLTGVYTKSSELKNVQGLTDVDMQDGSAWLYRTGYYPQLRIFTDLALDNFSNNELVESYSTASAATVFLNHWDTLMNENGNIENNKEAADIYDTIRDITSSFEFTSNGNSNSAGYDLTWEVDSETNKIKGYVEKLNIIQEDGSVKDVSVLSIKNPVKNKTDSANFGLDVSDIYKCYDFAPGKSWVKIIVENTLGNNVIGTRKLRLLPTAYIDAGNYTEISLVTDNDNSEDVTQNKVKIDGIDEIQNSYFHAQDTMYVITDSDKLADNKVVYPGQVVSQNKSEIDLFALWNRYPSDLNSTQATSKKFDKMYAQALLGNSKDSGLAKVEVYSLGVAYRSIQTDDGEVTVPVINYDEEKRITSDALNDQKWRGEKLFTTEDAGWYELKYYWRLKDGRYLTDSKIVVIKGNEISATLNNNIIKGEQDYNDENLKITPDIKQNTENFGDLKIDYARQEEEKRNVKTSINENGTVEKSIKIREFVDDELIAGWKNDDRYTLKELKVEISRDGAAWVSLPINLEDSSEAQYTYANQNWQVKQYTDTKQYYIDPTGDPIEITLNAKLIKDPSTENDYVKFKFTSDSEETTDLVTNSNIRVTATFVPVDKIKVDKKWEDDANKEGLRPENITLVLNGSDGSSYTQQISGDSNTDINWSYTFEVPKYSEQEQEISYTLDEKSTSDIYEKQIDESSNTIVNKIIKYNIKTKVDGIGGSISGQNQDSYEEVVKGLDSTKEIVITPDDGYEIESIKINGVEQELPNKRDQEYTLPILKNVTEDKEIIVKFRENRVNINVTKKWVDNENETLKRPTNIKLVVKNKEEVVAQTVISTENDTQSYTFQNLPKYDNESKEIIYTIDEEEVNSGDLKFYTKQINGSTITNTFTVPDEKVNVDFKKVWQDNENENNKRPTSIIAQVKKGTEVIKSVTLTGITSTWNYTFQNLPKYDSLGNEITYEIDEQEVNEGELKFYQKNIDNSTNTITNIFTVPEEYIEIISQKEWKNEPNTNKRPQSVVIQVKNGGSVVKEQEVSADTDWKTTFNGLPKYNLQGNEITYTIDEKEKDTDDLKFYEKAINNSTYTITNTFKVPDERVEYQVIKKWEDNSNIAKKRPQNIIVDLYSNGKVIRNQQIATLEDENTYTFEDLPKYDENGESIKYTVDERETNEGELYFYNKSINGNIITNTFTVPDEKINVEVKKIWNDNSNEHQKRPESLKLVLKSGEKVVSQSTIQTNGNQQVYEFKDLTKYNELGNEIKYTVDEEEINENDLKFYTKEIDNATNTITNTFKVPEDKVNVVAKKVWQDDSNASKKRPKSIYLDLYADGKKQVSQQITTLEDENIYTFENLAKYNEAGNEINYSIDESEINENDLKFYTKQINGNTITNTFTVPDEKVSVTIVKKWVDNSNENNKRPQNLKLVVRKSGEEVASHVITTENDEERYIFENLPKYNEQGNEINYTIDEEEVNDGDLDFYTKQINGETITNTFTVPADKVTLKASKTWNDNNDFAKKRPNSVIVVVLNGEEQVQEKTLNESNDWKCSFKDLPKYDSNGAEIKYTLAEKESTLGDLYFYETEVDNTNIKLKNTFRVPDEKVSVPVTKIWEDNSNVAQKRPSSIIIDLYADGVYSKSYTILDTSSDTQNYTFENLPKYNELGDVITYTVNEREVNKEDMKFYSKNVNGYTITNTFTVPDEKVSVPITKIWEDNSNAAQKRPNSILLKLYENGKFIKNYVLTDTKLSDTQSYIFENLAKYDSLGNEISYTVDEEEINEGDLKFYSKEVDNTTNTLTNKFVVPEEKTSFTVTKIWNDDNNKAQKRPNSILFELYANNSYVKEYLLTNTNVNSQSYTFENLPKYDDLGNVISYTIDEKEENEGDLKFFSKNINGNVITNTFRVPSEKIDITAKKIWSDNSNKNNKRPTSITLDLYANGVYSQSTTIQNVKDTDSQTYTFSGLLKYDSLGNEINYTIDESETAVGDLKFYTKSIDNSNKTITNSFTVPDEKVSYTVTKIWNDNNNKAQKRPSSIDIILKANEKEYKRATIEVSSSSQQNYTFENLPKYNQSGDVIVYWADEAETKTGDLYFYTKNIDGNVITNTFNVPDEKIECQVTKKWVDQTPLRRPDQIRLVLKDELGNKVDKTLLNTQNDSSVQTYIFKELAKYDELGNLKKYTVSEEEVNTNDLYFYNSSVDESTNTITNTFVLPEDKIDINVTKVWDDNDNKARKRPSSIIIQIKNGDKVVKSQKVTALMEWTFNFTDLPKYDEVGNEIAYIIDEAEVNVDDLKFYKKTVDYDTNTITNTFSIPEEQTSITITKTWEDEKDKYAKRPEAILIDAKNGTAVEKTYELSKDSTDDEIWTAQIDGLSKYNENGDIIRYTIDERAKKAGSLLPYTKQVKGYNITNTLKFYNITTQVDGDGGSISGQDEDCYEKVVYSGSTSKDIIVTPDKGYKISSIKINGKNIEFKVDENGSYKLEEISNVTEDKNIVVSFEKIDSKVLVKHVTEDGQELKQTEVIEGKYGTEYKTSALDLPDYDLVSLPENANGTMNEEQIIVTYVYKLVKGKIIVTKVDSKDENTLLKGAIFKVEKLTEEDTIDDQFEKLEIETGEDGKAEFSDLAIGKYRVTEVKAPDGYELSREYLDVEITKENREQEIKASNNLKLILPQTGGKNRAILISALGITIMVLSFAVLKIKKK